MARPAGIDKTASSLPVATDDSVALETSDEEVETGLGGGAAGCWGSKVAKDMAVISRSVASFEIFFIYYVKWLCVIIFSPHL